MAISATVTRAIRPVAASRLLRSMATLGGEAVHASPDSEVVAALLALNRLPEAEEAFKAVLARHPDHADALTNLSALLIKQNRNAEAAEALEAQATTEEQA